LNGAENGDKKMSSQEKNQEMENLIKAIEDSMCFLNLEYPTFQIDNSGMKLKL